MEKRTVPSFASFKPKALSTNPAISKERVKGDRDRPSRSDHEDRHERRHGSQRHRRSSHDRYRDGKERRRKDHENSSHHERRDQKPDLQVTSTSRPAEAEPEDSEYFMIDRRGDAKNIEYGGLHRYSIPSYHRIGYGRVLGADRYARIDRDAGTDRGLVLRFDRGPGAARAERLLTQRNARAGGRRQRLILPKAASADADVSMDTDADFLEVGPNLKRKRGSESPVPDVPAVDYRSVEGKAKPDPKPQDEDLEFDSSSDEDEDRKDAGSIQIRAQSAGLSRAAKLNPLDADAWLALVEHQCQATFPGVDMQDLTSSQRRSVADIRLSVLDQAFKHIGSGAPGHDRLLLKYMSEGPKIWEPTKLSQKWKDAVKQNSTVLMLWREYLGYLQTDHSTFRFEDCKPAYSDCLATLKNARNVVLKDKLGINETIVYVLLRFTRFTKDAGYDELALATWQAVLEYFIFAPDTLLGQTKLEAFGEFWESEAPRVGEDGAAGWRTSVSNPKPIPRKTSSPTWPDLDPQRPFASFAAVEKSTCRTLFFPAGAADEDEESDDPFRYVMFSDIKPILQRLPEQLDTKLLIGAFLCFMLLPPIEHESGHSRDWRSDPFLQSRQDIQGVGETTAQRYDSFSLFSDGFQRSSSSEASSFVVRILTALVAVAPDFEALGEYLLAFLNRTDSTVTAKTAKRLLKNRPTCMRYYNAYALTQAGTAEASLDKAQQIWIKALELSMSLSEDVQDDRILLWHSWMMSLVHRGDEDAALRVLLIMPDGSAAALQLSSPSISAGAVLRVRRHLEEGIDRMQLKSRTEHAALYGDCMAWLSYLSAGWDVNAALQSFSMTTAKFGQSSAQHSLELLHQAKARLLGRHITARRPFRPALFRDQMMESRRLFPENGVILKQYYEVAKLTRLDDRLRTALSEAHSASVAPQGLMSWLFAIDFEIERCSVDGASTTRDSVRALFRRALLTSDSSVKASPLLWGKWFGFEGLPLLRTQAKLAEQRQDTLRRAKEVFFDGLRFLPWSKSWIIDGMSTFAQSGDVSEKELRQIHDVLMERELRVRVDVDNLEQVA